MSTRKYRLAEPIDDDETNVLYRTASLMSPPLPSRFTILNNIEASTNRALLDKEEKDAEIAPSTLPPRWWLVLPCLILIIFATAADSLLLNDLVIRRYERRYGLNPSSNSKNEACRQSMTTSMPPFYWQFPPSNPQLTQARPDYTVVQRDAASFHVKNAIVGLIPALVTFVFLGSNCDTIGRRPLLLFPFIGKVIWYSLLLIIVSRNLSDAWLLTTHAIESAFGSVGLVMLSAFSYITDCTSGPMRTRAFLLAEGALFLTRVVPIIALGIWLRFYLYTVPLSICLASSVIGLAYALFIQPESVENVRNISLIQQLARIRLKPIVRVVQVFTVKRADNKRKQLAFLTIILILLQNVFLGYLSIFPLYLYGRPLCLDALHVSLLSASQAIVTFTLSILAAVSKKSFDSTYLAPVFGAFAIIVKLIIVGVAKRIWLLYIAVCIGSLAFIIQPVLRTKLTRLIETNEYAIVFIGAGIIDTIGLSAVGAAANGIYNASLNFFPGLIFWVFALVELFPIAIMCYLAFLERKTSRKDNARAISTSEMQT